jgi:hypothetical protein
MVKSHNADSPSTTELAERALIAVIEADVAVIREREKRNGALYALPEGGSSLQSFRASPRREWERRS